MTSRDGRTQEGQTCCSICGREIDTDRGIPVRDMTLCHECAHIWLERQQHLEEVRRM